jgi:thiamine-monophosphate kinase
MTTRPSDISSIGEFGLIERIRKILGDTPPGLIMGISDDAAVYRPAPGKVQVVSTDAFTEGIHFDLTFTSMKHLGWKVMAASLSDIAAMGALPRLATVAVSLPEKITVPMVEEFYRGIDAAVKASSCVVAGGDTTGSAGNMTVTVTVIGEADEGRLLFRKGAVPGDYLCVSGHLGSAIAGLKILEREKAKYLAAKDPGGFRPDLEPYAPALGKYFMPRPRFDIVAAAEPVRINAMIDISDGLASEVHHICRESVTGAEVYERNLPVEGITQRIASELGGNPTEYALFGGDEYELLFTLSDGEYGKLEGITTDVTIVGRITEKEKGVTYVREDGTSVPLPPGGWDHFPRKERSHER